MKHKIFLAFFMLTSSICFAQNDDGKYTYQDILVSCEGDISLYIKTGIIIYVSDENGQPACNGNYFTIKNKSADEIGYEAKVLEKYQKVSDSNRIIIATTPNILIYYPIMPNSNQTIQLIDYKSKKDQNQKVYLSLTLKIPIKQNATPDLNEWNKIFTKNNNVTNNSTIKKDTLFKTDSENKTVYQADDKIFYNGNNSDLIRILLTKVSGWKTPKSLDINDGIPPKVEQTCVRDNYIAAAVNYAWAAEGYFRLNEVAKANDMAAKAAEQVSQALSLCSDISLTNEKCPTENIISCDDKNKYQSVTNSSNNNSQQNTTESNEAATGTDVANALGIGNSNAGQALGTILDVIAASRDDASFYEKQKEKQYEYYKKMKQINEEYQTKYGISIIQFTNAIKNDSIEVVEQALKRGYPVNTPVFDFDETYFDAYFKKHTDIVSQPFGYEIKDIKKEFPYFGTYIYVGDDYYKNPLHYSAQLGKPEFIKLFLKYGININETIIIGYYGKNGVGDDNNRKDMRFYAGNDYSKITPRGIEKWKWTALHYAVYYKHPECVTLLLQKGADKNIKAYDDYWLSTNKNYLKQRFTPYELAKKMGFFEIADLLK